jgi:hypothetical protein
MGTGDNRDRKMNNYTPKHWWKEGFEFNLNTISAIVSLFCMKAGMPATSACFQQNVISTTFQYWKIY